MAIYHEEGKHSWSFSYYLQCPRVSTGATIAQTCLEIQGNNTVGKSARDVLDGLIAAEGGRSASRHLPIKMQLAQALDAHLGEVWI
jgi:hypothetical protein